MIWCDVMRSSRKKSVFIWIFIDLYNIYFIDAVCSAIVYACIKNIFIECLHVILNIQNICVFSACQFSSKQLTFFKNWCAHFTHLLNWYNLNFFRANDRESYIFGQLLNMYDIEIFHRCVLSIMFYVLLSSSLMKKLLYYFIFVWNW